MKLDPVRTKRQDEVINKWTHPDNGGEGTLIATTGFGKTFTAFRGIKRLRKKWPDSKVVVVVPSTYLHEQWTTTLKALNLYENTEVWVINGLVQRYKEENFTLDAKLLVLDEVHSYAAPTFKLVFDCVHYDFVLGLTATLDDDDPRYDIIRGKAPVIDRIPLKECLDNGWVAPFIIYNLGIHLSSDEQEVYDELNKKYHQHFSVFQHDFRLAMSCLSDKRNAAKYADKLGYDTERVYISAINWNRNMRKRKNFLYNLDSKVKVGKNIFQRFQDKLIISFSQSTDFADRIAEVGGGRAMAYHSNVEGETIHGEYFGKKRMKELAIRRFSDPSNQVNIISTANAMDMGVDIPRIDMACVFSGTSKVLQGLQRYGRAIRKDGDKRAIIIEVYALGTQDEKWLRKRQKKTPSNCIKHIRSVDEINLD